MFRSLLRNLPLDKFLTCGLQRASSSFALPLAKSVKMVPEKLRKIKFTDYDVLGFDMDFTLARYKEQPEFFRMVYKLVVNFLVNEEKYDPSIFGNCAYNTDFIFKDLVVHYETGNILKLGRDGEILRATHGTQKMEESDIKEAYGADRKFPFFDEYKSGKKNVTVFQTFETFFDIPCALAYAKMIDWADLHNGQNMYSKIAGTVGKALAKLYAPDDKGSFYEKMETELPKYITAKPNMKEWLQKLKQDSSQDRIVFLMTASYPKYASSVMQKLLGHDWRSCFDVIIYGARKPRFFSEKTPFRSVENLEAGEEVHELKKGGEFLNGNYEVLMNFLKKVTKLQEPKVIHFGDTLWSDAAPCKTLAQWDTVMIFEDMNAERYHESQKSPWILEIINAGGHHESKMTRKRKAIEDECIDKQDLCDEERELMTSDFWGSHFFENAPEGSTKMNTATGCLISENADICVPSIEYLAGLQVDHEFTTFAESAGSVSGFHPESPQVLLRQNIEK